jgi:hypothetical protein
MALMEGLQGSARAIFDGLRLSKARDPNALSALDSQLANSKPTDAWYPQAARLRAEWRRYAGSRETHVDALAILERALAVGPNTDLLLLRVAHAAALQRYRVVLESANLLIASCAKKIHDKRARPISRSQRRFIHNNAATLGKMIAGIDTPNDGRKKAVLHKVQALLKHMKSTQRERRRSN